MASAPPAAGSSALPPLSIPKPKKTQAWALVESEFEEGLVGGKAGNLAKLRGKLPAGVSGGALCGTLMLANLQGNLHSIGAAADCHIGWRQRCLPVLQCSVHRYCVG